MAQGRVGVNLPLSGGVLVPHVHRLQCAVKTRRRKGTDSSNSLKQDWCCMGEGA